MASTLISAKLPPDIDPTKARLAYGERALPKLNEELNSKDLYTQQKALAALTEVLHNPECIARAIECSIVESLKYLVTSPDAVVRMKTTEAFLIIAGHAIGREVLIDESVIKPLAKMFDDQCYEVRLNSHLTIEMMSSSPPGPESLVECGLIPILIKKLSAEHDEIKLLVLDALHRCMRVNHQQALENNAMAAYTQLLDHEKPEVRSKAAQNIKELSFPTQGKDEACNVGSVEALAKLLTDKDVEVRTQSCAALMVITITTRGKYLAMDCRIIPRLLQMLKDDEVDLRLNALKLITTLSETPTGRSEFLMSLPEVARLKNDDVSAAVRKAAQIAEKTITWKP